MQYRHKLSNKYRSGKKKKKKNPPKADHVSWEVNLFSNSCDSTCSCVNRVVYTVVSWRQLKRQHLWRNGFLQVQPRSISLPSSFSVFFFPDSPALVLHGSIRSVEEHIQSRPAKTTSILSLMCAFLHGLSQPGFQRKCYYYSFLVTGRSRFTQTLCDRREGLDRYVTRFCSAMDWRDIFLKGIQRSPHVSQRCMDYCDVPGTSDLNPNL